MSRSLKGMMSSDRQDWGTPDSFMEWLGETKGFYPDLDAAASDDNTKAPYYFTKEDDALKQDWFGSVWLNPPFGNEIAGFMQKCAEQIKRPEVHEIYVLIPARTDTKWFHEIVMPHAYLVYLIKGRFNFRFDRAVPSANAPFPSMLVVYRPSRTKYSFNAGIVTLDVPKEARGFGV